MPTPSSLAAKLTRFTMAALQNGSAITAKAHKVTDLGRQLSLVSWECEEAPDLSNISIEDVRSYLFFLANDHYSLICEDGALIQMSFKIHRGNIVHHRLCYLPCPVAFDATELVQDSLYRIVERNLSSGKFDILKYCGALRFDFDPNAADARHPSSHLTLNYDQVRMPVGRSLDANTFLGFLDSHFIGSRPNMRRFALPIGGDSTRDVLTPSDRRKLHVSWFPDL